MDKASATVVNTIPSLDNRLSKATGGTLQVSWANGTPLSPNNEVGIVLIHTRKSASLLAVSSQEIVMNGNSILSSFVGNTWYQTCIDTYGLTDEVPLDPSFPEASIQSVTANGSAVSEGDTLEGSQELVITGANLSTRSVKVFFGDVEYTPLTMEGGSMQYLIGNNGNVRVVVNGHDYLNFSVSGVVIPESLGRNKSIGQTDEVGTDFSVCINKLNSANYCVNYPRMSSAEYPYYIAVNYCGTNEGVSDYVCHNCTFENFVRLSNNQGDVCCLSVVDSSQPAWLTYQGFIIAVFNYSL